MKQFFLLVAIFSYTSYAGPKLNPLVALKTLANLPADVSCAQYEEHVEEQIEDSTLWQESSPKNKREKRKKHKQNKNQRDFDRQYKYRSNTN